MDPTAAIRKLGFRRWYERQLIDCHLALVTCFLSALVMAACLEGVNLLELNGRALSMLMVVFVAGIVGWLAWRRYITVLERAERYGQRSTCPECLTYARFEIVATGVDSIPGEVALAVAPLAAPWLRVKCRKCGTLWRMPE